ncbi:MAG: amidase family protein [Bacteroidota bacterium]
MIRIILVALVTLVSACQPRQHAVEIDLSELTVADIHNAYNNGDYTAEQLVEAYIARIQQFDQATGMNAIVLINPDAREDARALDIELQNNGTLRPLHGIPMIVKDNYNTIGLQTAAGSVALKGFTPDTDAFQVSKLKEAGAIIIAKSNMAEWAFSPRHTESSLAGTTRNPYNLAHVPAGSSGGTGAGVASNFGTIGLGTDTGNSIRGPSSHNALVGFRSTLGLTSREGIVPLYLRNDVGGPMCRTVEDATRVLEVIAGHDPADPVTKYSEGKIPENYMQFLQPDGLQGARIGVLRALSDDDPHPEVNALFEQAIEDLQHLGAAIVDPVQIPDFASLRQNQWCAAFKNDLEEYLATYVKRDSIQTLEDVIAYGGYSAFVGDGLNYMLENEGRSEAPNIACKDPFTDALRIAFREAIENEMDRLNLDAIVYPSWNHPPSLLDDFMEGYKGDNSQIISPHTGQPAFTVPMGFTTGNLPAGLQFLGRMFDEPTLIRLAYAYEQGTRHRKPPVLE